MHRNTYRSIQKRQDRLGDNSSGERKQVSSTPKPWKVVRPKKEQLVDDFGAVKHNITGSGSQHGGAVVVPEAAGSAGVGVC